MNVLRRLTVSIVIVIATGLGTAFFTQVVLCHPYGIRNYYLCKWNGEIRDARQICSSNGDSHSKGNYGNCILCEETSFSESIAQFIDLEDENTLTLDHNRSGEKVSPSGTISTCHYLRKCNSSYLPLYLLKSSFLL